MPRIKSGDTIAAVQVVGPSLVLRYPAPADAPALFELGSDPEVTRFFSWGPYTSAEEPAAYIERVTEERERGERLEFLIVDRRQGNPIGVTGLSEFNRRDRRAVIGTWLARANWGTGANREGKALIAFLGFSALGLERLGAYADLDNPRSQAALTSIGFTREGVLRRWHRHGDQVHDVLLYSWLKAEWQRSALAATATELSGEPPPAFSSAAAPS
jgi:ribosomal-protein-alanine N-acetyltransferase